MKKSLTAAGFTLLEALIVVALLAILAAIAMPSFQGMMERQKIRSAMQEWQSSFYLAQREAMRLKEAVTLCGSEDGTQCNAGNNAHDFSKGWIVITSRNVVLQDKAFDDASVRIYARGNQFKTSGFRFLSTGRLQNSAAGTLVVKHSSVADENTAEDADHRTRLLAVSSGGRLTGVR